MNDYDPDMNPNMEPMAIVAAEQIHRDWLDPKRTAANYADIKEACRLAGYNYDSFLVMMGSYLRPLFEKEPKMRGGNLDQDIDTAIMKTVASISFRNSLNRLFNQN